MGSGKVATPVMKILTMILVSSLLLYLAMVQAAWADVSAQIEQIERLPRAQRPGVYQDALAAKGLAEPDRKALAAAFAKHAKDLSPHYGKGKFAFDPQAWRTMLKQGFDPDKPDANVAMALGQLLIDSGDRTAAAPVVDAFRKAFPQHHVALAWQEWCESGGPKGATNPLTFPVHFCVATSNLAARPAATRANCRKEVEILNKTFRTLDGGQLVQFEFKGYVAYEAVKDINSELVELLEKGDASEGVMKAFNNCDDARVRDRSAINIYIYDSKSAAGGDKDMTSHGRRNSNRPYVLIDWQRMGGKVQNAQAHEMGHAFGLEHVGVPGATVRSSTNIMTSAAESFGSGGLRDLGFTPSQSAIILYHAQRTAERLGLKKK
jgi:hypothetical protein